MLFQSAADGLDSLHSEASIRMGMRKDLHLRAGQGLASAACGKAAVGMGMQNDFRLRAGEGGNRLIAAIVMGMGIGCFFQTAGQYIVNCIALVGVGVDTLFLFQLADQALFLGVARIGMEMGILLLFQTADAFLRFGITGRRMRVLLQLAQRAHQNARFIAGAHMGMHHIIRIAANSSMILIITAIFMGMHADSRDITIQLKLSRHRLGDIAGFNVGMFLISTDFLIFQGDCRQDQRIGSTKYHQTTQHTDYLEPAFPPFLIQ